MNPNHPLRTNIVFILFLMLVSVSTYATHLRAGEITAERVLCTARTFRITVTVYTNTNTTARFGGADDWLEFGDGNRILVAERPNIPRPDLGLNMGIASYTIEYTYSGDQEYIISYSEPNRNEGVVNMDQSINTKFYIETRISIDPFFGCNNTPQLRIPPIDNACKGVMWTHNPGAFDPDLTDSLSYELVIPFQRRNTPVTNYRDPTNSVFYVGPYNSSNEEGNGPPTFKIHPTEGTLTWDAPGMAGPYNIAFIVREWRKINGVWMNISFVRRDMQIIVEDCQNNRPDLIVPKDICVEAGSIIDEKIIGTDPDGDPVRIEAYSQIFELAPAESPATYSPNDAQFRPQPIESQFHWNTSCLHVREQPYQVVFKITDQSPTGSKLVTFKTWFIRVVGPKPVLETAQVNPLTREATLSWDSYACQNAQTIQVWRRVDSFPFSPDSCQTGMPDDPGYQLIASLPVKDGNNIPITSYRDTNNGVGLATGAQYCYRLLALFPLPKGGESYVSNEVCIDPIDVDEPVITNVSITKTADAPNGEIFIRWTRPFEIDKTKYPELLGYKVLRAEGFNSNVNLTDVTGAGTILSEGDTVFTDIGSNTKDKKYNFRIVLYSGNQPIDTSDIASTVRLEALSEVGRITLNWDAVVPWSNRVLTEPNDHDVYKGPEGSQENNLVLIQRVDPITAGLRYDDNTVQVGQKYCYRVMTRGAYGNPLIEEPLENFSQILCAEPNDEERPCAPTLIVNVTDCQKFIASTECNAATFENVLRWNNVNTDCANDVVGYKVYRASHKDGPFEWLSYAGEQGDGIISDTSFIDKGPGEEGLSSMAYCYRVSAVDRSNNESEWSESACNDNCPYYELPNVFTPNDPNECNSTFSAWRPLEYYRMPGEEGFWKCGIVDRKCARFVKSVRLTILNRWGKEVYKYKSGGERTIYIDWDGRTEDGTELASGIYYYSAEVKFNMIEPSKQIQIFKGWVHLIR
jgi:hypothetical protein